MDIELIVLLGSAALLCVVLLFGFASVRRELRRASANDPTPAMVVLQNQLDALRDQLRSSLEGGRVEIDRRLEQTNRVVSEVRRELGAVDRQVRTVSEAARDLRGLQELLRSPKLRGGIGEFLLEELLSQVLPREHYELQYGFPDGGRVDAALRIGDAWVPVDAKFPMENFQRLRERQGASDERGIREAARALSADVRRHVDGIARKYIQPGHGTYDFALMYVPAESVYQEMLVTTDDPGTDLLQYALARQVVPVSPQTFYAYLQVIVLGLRGLSIEERAREIMGQIGAVRGQLDRFAESFETANRHLNNAQRQFDSSRKRLERVDRELERMIQAPEASQNRIETPPKADVPPRSRSPEFPRNSRV